VWFNIGALKSCGNLIWVGMLLNFFGRFNTWKITFLAIITLPFFIFYFYVLLSFVISSTYPYTVVVIYARFRIFLPYFFNTFINY